MTPNTSMTHRGEKTDADSPPDRPIQVYPMAIWDLDNPSYRLKVDCIPISVEEWEGDGFAAHWHDVEAVGFGDTIQETLADLRQCIIELYEDLMNEPDDKLGKLTLAAKRILAKAIEKC